MSKFDNISEKNNSHIYSIFRTETSRDPKGVTTPLWSLDYMATLARIAGVFVQERGTRVKDRTKNGACKIPFLVLSLLRNQRETLATQAMRHEIHNYFFFFGRWAIWLSNYDHRYQLRSLHGDYFLLGCPFGQRSIKKYLLFIYIEKRPNGGRNF